MARDLTDPVVRGDALLLDWPEVDAIVGNPPFQSKNRSQKEMEVAYLNAVRARHPGVDGRADYCVYWFRRAHDHLKPGQRAGLVGTNTIRQNYTVGRPVAARRGTTSTRTRRGWCGGSSPGSGRSA